MANPDIKNYNAVINNEGNPFIDPKGTGITDSDSNVDDNEETPDVVLHMVPENKARWNHIEDLDSFFTRMYQYHQKHGFCVMMVQEFFQLFQFAFVVSFVVYLLNCVNYPIAFKWIPLPNNHTKVTLPDVLEPVSECVHTFSASMWSFIILAIVIWCVQLMRVFYHFIQYYDIKKFYNTALKIPDCELDNLTWHDIQRKIREVQSEQQMCIHKEQLTELDIYHRILRFKNYMVAMMNKNLLPSKLNVPYFGECICLSKGLKFNIELILFRGGIWSAFENNWHLREEFKRANKRTELAQKLASHILLIAIANLILSPLIFLWQFMYWFFNYADLIKREPGALGVRCWSQYGTLYLRHFNELEHELRARLTRAYRPATKYMTSFSSPLMAVIAQNTIFIFGGIPSAILLIAIVFDEDIMLIEHVLTIVTGLGIIAIILRAFIPDENLIWCPEQLMTAVLAHVHYLPVAWRGLAHTNRVREQFEKFFQLRAIYMLNELLSPFTTPFILIFVFRPRALDVVDFFRNFSVSVVGVGDVCSFAQMDVRKHGNPDWQLTNSNTDYNPNNTGINNNDGNDGGDDDDDDYDDDQYNDTDLYDDANNNINDDKKKRRGRGVRGGRGGRHPIDDRRPGQCQTNQYTQGEHGKTELSLVHFTLTNPEWKMPVEAKKFVHSIRQHALQEMDCTRMDAVANTAMGHSLFSVENMGDAQYSSIIQSIMQTQRLSNSQMGLSLFPSPTQGHNMARNPFNLESSFMPMPMPQQQQNVIGGSAAGKTTAAPERSTILQNIREDDDDDNKTNTPNNDNNQNYNIVNNNSNSESYQRCKNVNRNPEVIYSSQMNSNNTGINSRSNLQSTTLPSSMITSVRGCLSKQEGPADAPRDGLLLSLYTGSTNVTGGGGGVDGTTSNSFGPVSMGGSMVFNDQLSSSRVIVPTHQITAADMCLSTLYLHELHHRQIQRRGGLPICEQQRELWQLPHQQQQQSQHQPHQSTSLEHQQQQQRHPQFEYHHHQQQQQQQQRNPLSGSGGNGSGSGMGSTSATTSGGQQFSLSSAPIVGTITGNIGHSSSSNPERTPLLSQKKT